MAYPCVTADLNKIRENVNRAADLCHSRGQTFAAVTKCVCGDARVLQALEDTRCDWLADARIDNLRRMKTKKPRFLIRLTQPWEAADTVAYSELSLESEPAVIALLGAEATRQGKTHRVVLACDLGDLREGCFFRDEADILAAAEAVLSAPGLELCGVGMSLGDFGGVMPCRENMEGLVHIAQTLRRRYHIPLPVVSGGSTTMAAQLLADTVAPGINGCRIGELWLAGHDPATDRDVPGFARDCFVLQAQLIELKTKPSKPIGPIGGDAFGHVVEWPDEGMMRRGIIACGKQDTEPDRLYPTDARIRVLGGSSDHIVLDMTGAPEYRVGDVLSFRLGYGAILRAYTSAYVERRYKAVEE